MHFNHVIAAADTAIVPGFSGSRRAFPRTNRIGVIGTSADAAIRILYVRTAFGDFGMEFTANETYGMIFRSMLNTVAIFTQVTIAVDMIVFAANRTFRMNAVRSALAYRTHRMRMFCCHRGSAYFASITFGLCTRCSVKRAVLVRMTTVAAK